MANEAVRSAENELLFGAMVVLAVYLVLKYVGSQLGTIFSNAYQAVAASSDAAANAIQSTAQAQSNLSQLASLHIPDYVLVPGTGKTAGQLRSEGLSDSDIAALEFHFYMSDPASGYGYSGNGLPMPGTADVFAN